MKDTLVVFIGHNIDKFSAKQFYKLKNELPENYDLIWATEDKNKTVLFTGPTWYLYPHSCLEMSKYSKFYGWVVCPNVILERIYEKRPDYKQYYVIEYDVVYKGNYEDIFNKLDTLNYDFITSYIRDDNNALKEWVDDYKAHFNVDENITHFYKSFNCFYRISNAALKSIIDYDGDLKKCLYELSYPTLLAYNGFSMASLDMDELTNEQFKVGLDIVSRETYAFENEWESEDKLPNINDKLFTRCKFAL